MSTKGQGHQSHLDSIFLNFFSSITARPIEAKFHVALPCDWGMEVSSNGLGHMTKMAAITIYVKTFKNFLRNQNPDDLETLVPFGTTKSVQMMTMG